MLISVISIALNSMMSSFINRLEFRLEAYAWTGENTPKIESYSDKYYIKVVIPVVAGNYN